MGAAADFTTDVLALGTLGMLALSAALLVAIALREKLAGPIALARPYILPFAALLTFAASALTLVYSEIFGMVPCFLCWLQRAFMYPMPFILGYALARRFDAAWAWVLGLSVPGLIVALYQHYLQMGGGALVACPAVPGAEDCGQRLIFEFGFVTFPLMAAAAFTLVALLMILWRVSRPRTLS